MNNQKWHAQDTLSTITVYPHEYLNTAGTEIVRYSGEGSALPKELRERAHLIAAAPDGYALARELVTAYEAHTDGYARQVLRPHYEAAKAFLAKAEGRPDA